MGDDARKNTLDGITCRQTEEVGFPHTVAASPISDPSEDAMLLRAARQIASIRTRRSQHFRGELFAEPAWDMLIDLFIAHLEGRQIYVSSLCIAAGVPATTALRYIQDLERHGEIISTPDAEDGRRRWLWLSESTAAAMRALLTGRIAWLQDHGSSQAVN
jgi:hypothetical protein